jgi:uncharacterized protein YtpQ (UPF0354 family)
MEDESFTRRAIAYLKARVADDGGPAVGLSHDDSFVMRPLADPLVVTYAVDTGNAYQLVQHRHLVRDAIDAATLHDHALANLGRLVNSKPTRVHPYGNIFAVTMGGDFEASLILLDQLWEHHLRQFVKGEYAVAVPARDILAFCDASSAAGLSELRELIQRVFPGGDHLLSDQIYVRRSTWEPLGGN